VTALLLLAALCQETPPPPPPTGHGAYDAVWDSLRDSPGAHSRNNVWATGINVPPFEGSTVVPVGALVVRGWVDGTEADFSDDHDGGESSWQTLWFEGGLQADYGVIPNFQVGLRLSAGTLKEQRGHEITLFDAGEQVTRNVDDGFTLESAVVRVKYANRFQDYFDFNILVEAKAPLGDDDNGANSDTFDFGFQVGAAREVVPGLTIHAAFGVVAPSGETEYFTRDGDPRIFYTWAFGATFRASDAVSLVVQTEGNTSPWTHLDVIAQTMMTAGFGVRWRIFPPLILDAHAGWGLEDVATDWYATVGVTYSLQLR
jgi:hypothetical protein